MLRSKSMYYPAPALVTVIPFAILSVETAGAAFIFVSAALLAYGITSDGWYRLPVIASIPFMKGMIPIGRPFLDYVISALADAGFERVCLVVGPEHDAVRDYYIREQPPSRIEIEFATQEKPLGTADAVLAAELFAGGESFVVLNSDNYYPIAALAKLRHSDAPAIIGFARSALLREGNVQADRVERFGALTIDGDGYLVRMVPRQGDAVPTYHGDVYASMTGLSERAPSGDVAKQKAPFITAVFFKNRLD